MRRKFMGYGSIAVIGLAAHTASAQEQGQAATPCTWTIQGDGETTGGDTQNVDAGKRVTVLASCDAPGTFTVPTGWTKRTGRGWINGWKPGACIGRSSTECGTYAADLVATEDGTYGFHYEGAADETKTFFVDVNDAPVRTGEAFPMGRGEVVERDVSTIKRRGIGQRWFDLAGSGIFTPNDDTTTRYGLGWELAFGARPGIEHFKLGAAVRWMRTGIPINEALRPTASGTDEDTHMEVLRAMGVITPADWCFIDLGGELGLATFSYHTTMVGQQNGRDTFVLENSQPTGVIGPHAQIALLPQEFVGFTLGFDMPITFTGIDSVVGGHNSKTRITPIVRGGLAIYF